MSAEDNLWAWLRDRLPRGHATRIESECSPGFPDVHFSLAGYPGRSVTFELKVGEGKKNPLRGKIRDSQYRWIPQQVRNNGFVWLVAEVGAQVLFIPGSRVDPTLETASPLDLVSRSTLYLPRRMAMKQVPAAKKDITDLIVSAYERGEDC